MTYPRRLLPALAWLAFAAPLPAASPPLEPETVAPFPAAAARLAVAPPDRVVAFDLARTRPEVAVLVQGPAGPRLLLWTLGDPSPPPARPLPAGFEADGIAWHPAERILFLAARRAGSPELARLDPGAGDLVPTTLVGLPGPARDLLVGPRPFSWWVAGKDGKEGRMDQGYRLFFGCEEPGKPPRILSTTDAGARLYQVVGPKDLARPPEGNDDNDPEVLESPRATPVAFHPAGHQLLWTDGATLQVATYGSDNWAGTRTSGVQASHARFPANGAGLMTWDPAAAGVALHMWKGSPPLPLATGTPFVGTPTPTPDGGGLVGPVEGGLAYVRAAFPLGDVANAWQILAAPGDTGLFTAHGALFRPGYDQIFRIYEFESYGDGAPARPYLVTTDLFWELFGAAFRGIFMLRERERSIPAFWAMVEAFHRQLATRTDAGRLPGILAALDAFRREDLEDPEAARIEAATGTEESDVLGGPYSYGELMPRGHYTALPPLARYFKAFKYLAGIRLLEPERSALAALPADLKAKAMEWITPYLDFVASPRAPLLWSAGFAPPAYCRAPLPEPRVFPLGWGIDNELLESVVFHEAYPGPERVVTPEGAPRLLPSTLDLAAALGSGTARTLEAEALARYPNLGAVLDLAAKRIGSHPASTLYDRWMNALAVQWAEDRPLPEGFAAPGAYRVKRLQTGLGAWTNLRHVTVLVNERSAAEAGESGFEYLLQPPPKGAVEPDPETFLALAGLFDAAAAGVRAGPDPALRPPGAKLDEAAELEASVRERLVATAAATREFAAMAAKERAGQALTDAEYEKIDRVAALGEHQLLVFRSLGRPDLGLTEPDPVSKVVDVAGSPATGFLLAAMGDPLTYEQVVPFRGRRQIVRGAAYAYYELQSPELLDDDAWRARLPQAARPAWVERLFSPHRDRYDWLAP